MQCAVMNINCQLRSNIEMRLYARVQLQIAHAMNSLPLSVRQWQRSTSVKVCRLIDVWFLLVTLHNFDPVGITMIGRNQLQRLNNLRFD